jgi:hypothetical protein
LLGRRRGEVGVGVKVIGVVVKVIVVVFGVSFILVLLLRVLLLGARWRTIIRHPISGGDVLLGGVVRRQFVLAGRRAAGKLDGVIRQFLYRLKEKGMMDEEQRWFQRAPGLKYIYNRGYAALRLQVVEVMVI